MRTTVTLDPDVERLLQRHMRRGRKSFKQALNEAVRLGLKDPAAQGEPEFIIQARAMGLRPGIDPARVRELDDDLELEEFLRKDRELRAKLQ